METLLSQRPGPILAPFVDVLWYFQTDSLHAADHVLPHGAFELVISLNGTSGENVIAGPHTRPVIVDPGSANPIVGAHFRAGGAAALLGYPARDFRDRDVLLEDVWNRRARELYARLQEISNPHHALALLEHELTRTALEAATLHPAVATAIDEFHRPAPSRRIRDLVLDAGVSQRRFIQLFTEQIGLTPKLYARIQRFQRTLHHAANKENVDWAALAYESGYSDQAHLIRDFSEFSGIRPGEYAPRWAEHPNHVPIKTNAENR